MQLNKFSPWPNYTSEEVSAVSRVLESGKVNYWTGGEGREFEKEFSAWCGVQHSVAMMNGTVALEAAMRALGIGKNDEVIVTARTYFASISSIVAVGATPVFADVSGLSQNITAETVRSVVSKKTKAIMCVHLAGLPCEMEEIVAFAVESGLYVIEDCAQAHGARYKGASVGSLGDIAAWSFCQDKIMTTGGEGGMVTTNNTALWERAWSLKDHGKSRSLAMSEDHPIGFRWLHESFGTNWRMTEMQAAIGRIQLRKMSDWHLERKRNAQKIVRAARAFPAVFFVPDPPEYLERAWYKCYLFVRPEGLKKGWNRNRMLEEIQSRGVPCFSGSCPEVYKEKAVVDRRLAPQSRLPVAEQLGETSLMFLVHPGLSAESILLTSSVIAEVAQIATDRAMVTGEKE